jgi:hypothetical protein
LQPGAANFHLRSRIKLHSVLTSPHARNAKQRTTKPKRKLEENIRMPEFRFMRFVHGVRKAEGARVRAETEAEAREKAARLFTNPRTGEERLDPGVLILRTEQNRMALYLREIEETHADA